MLKVENSTVEKVQFKTLNALEHHNFILRNFNSLIIRRLYVWHKIWILQRLRDRRKQQKEK